MLTALLIAFLLVQFDASWGWWLALSLTFAIQVAWRAIKEGKNDE